MGVDPRRPIGEILLGMGEGFCNNKEFDTGSATHSPEVNRQSGPEDEDETETLLAGRCTFLAAAGDEQGMQRSSKAS